MKRFVLPLLLLTLLLPCLAQAQEYKIVGLKDLTSIVAQNKGKVVMLNFFAPPAVRRSRILSAWRPSTRARSSSWVFRWMRTRARSRPSSNG
mgnify:CR=1 FL=1